MPDLGICYAQPFWHDGETYSTNDTSIVFPLHVGRDHFDDVHLYVPVRRATGDGDDVGGPLSLDLGTPDSLVPGLAPERVVVHPLPFRSRTREWYTPAALPDVATAAATLRRHLPRSDLVWMPGPPHVPTMLCYSVCRRYDVPAFLYLRSDQRREIGVQEFSGWRSLGRRLAGRVLPRIERHIVERVPTLVTGSELHDRYEDSAGTVHTVRSIHLSERHVLDDAEFAVSRNRGTRVLYVGRLVPVKGVDQLVEAVSMLVESGHDVSLDIVGTGKREAALREQARRSAAAERISFRGFVPFGPALFERYRSADVVVLPSHSEGFPNVVIEAMANGTPVISTNVGGIDEVVTHERNGLLVPPGDPAAIANQITRLGEDAELRARLIRNGLDVARELTVERQSEKLLDVLRTEFPGVVE